jgi:hypothetical protein
VIAVADSIRAPNTSPVIPPSRRCACLRASHAAPSAATCGPSTQPTGIPAARASSAPSASTPAVHASTAGTGTPSATSAPKPLDRADRTPRTAACTAATRPVAAATARIKAGDQAFPATEPAAAPSAPITMMRVTTPNGPMSDLRMISSAWSAGARLPSPSAVSASPSRCRQRVSTASTATASTAPSGAACGAHCRIAPAGSPATAPRSAPMAGSHSRAATPSPGRKAAPSARTGRIVNRLAERRADAIEAFIAKRLIASAAVSPR